MKGMKEEDGIEELFHWSQDSKETYEGVNSERHTWEEGAQKGETDQLPGWPGLHRLCAFKIPRG